MRGQAWQQEGRGSCKTWASSRLHLNSVTFVGVASVASVASQWNEWEIFDHFGMMDVAVWYILIYIFVQQQGYA